MALESDLIKRFNQLGAHGIKLMSTYTSSAYDEFSQPLVGDAAHITIEQPYSLAVHELKALKNEILSLLGVTKL